MKYGEVEVIPIKQGNLNRLAADCHAANQHWWHDPATGERLHRNTGEMFMLMVSEIAEAMEGERKSLMDDKLPHRPMPEVELADALIRIFDYAGARRLDLDRGVATVDLPIMPDNKGAALLQIARDLANAGQLDLDQWPWRLCAAILLIIRYASVHGYDLDGAVAEKRAFNATRADHQAAARLAANGKKW